MYVFCEYPKWMFHPSLPAVVVKDPDEEKKLGSDWFERPEQAQAALEAIKVKLEKAKAKS